MSRDDGMNEHGIDWICGCWIVSSGRILAWKLGKSPLICQTLTTHLTQPNSHGPDDYPETIDYHLLDMSRDDGMDEHGIDWLCGCWITSLPHSLGKWVTEMLIPLQKAQPSYFKDSFALKDLLDALILPSNAQFFTNNATSMYTNIKTDPELEEITKYIIDMLEVSKLSLC
jgi:hypothetical protein